jgi:hypothetical protein
MQNDHTQPPNITRKIRICYVQLARTLSSYRVEKAEGMKGLGSGNRNVLLTGAAFL